MQDSQGSGNPSPERDGDWPSTAGGDVPPGEGQDRAAGEQASAPEPPAMPATGPLAVTPGGPTLSPDEDAAPGEQPGVSGDEAGAAGIEPASPGSSWVPTPPDTGAGTADPAPPGQPSSGQPSSGQPSSGQPSSGQPSSGQPSFGEPGASQPSLGEPRPGEPGFGEPPQPTFGLTGRTIFGEPGQQSYGQPSEPGQPRFGEAGQAGQPSFGAPGQSGPGQFGSSQSSEPGFGQSGQPTPGQPTPGQPTPGQPDYGQPTFGEPGLPGPSRPTYGQPGYGQPDYGQPGATGPGTDQPGYGEPGYGQPSYGQPDYGQGGGQPADTSPPIWQSRAEEPPQSGGPYQPGGPYQAGGQPQAGSQPQPGGPYQPPGPPPPGGQGQGTWVTPSLPAEPGTWTLPPGGQGNWGPPGGGGYGQPQGPQPPRRTTGFGRVMIFVVVAALAAALGAGVVLALQGSPRNSASGVSPRDLPTIGSGNGSGNGDKSTIDPSTVADKVQPGMVDITSHLRYSGQIFEGTGMILSASGLVLTNNHVVNGSTSLQVTLVDSGRSYNAQIVGTDSADDVALLKLQNASGLKPIQVGDSSKVKLGTPVVALGNAGGTGGSPTVTSGTITALNRTITASDSGSQTSETLHNMLQTNAPIAEGDSGGPLANATGQVIGMDTAANTRTLGGAGTDQGFAIPINRALSIARQMAAGHAGGQIHLGQPPFLGIEIASASATAASTAANPHTQLQQLQKVASANGGGVDSTRRCLPGQTVNPVPSKVAPVDSGTLVAGVFCQGPATSAAMHGGDVITAVNGQAVTSPASLKQIMLAHYHPGDSVSLSWVDTSGQHHTSSIKLAAGPAS